MLLPESNWREGGEGVLYTVQMKSTFKNAFKLNSEYVIRFPDPPYGVTFKSVEEAV